MPNPLSSIWQPTKIRRVEETYDTGSEVVAVTTDAGRAFVKLRGNKEGPHVLVCEFVGTRLAAQLGLPTFEHTTMHYDGTPAIEFPSGNQAGIGTAWITRREEGIAWSGNTDDLRLLANLSDLALLVAVDQWTRNCDRYRPEPLRVNRNNVFFSRADAPEGRFRLIAMDFTHAFTCGSPLSPALAHIGRVQDEMRFGLFPEFAAVIQREQATTAAATLRSVSDADIMRIVNEVPSDWDLDAPTRTAMIRFLSQRRDWLAAEFVRLIFPQDELFN